MEYELMLCLRHPRAPDFLDVLLHVDGLGLLGEVDWAARTAWFTHTGDRGERVAVRVSVHEHDPLEFDDADDLRALGFTPRSGLSVWAKSGTPFAARVTAETAVPLARATGAMIVSLGGLLRPPDGLPGVLGVISLDMWDGEGHRDRTVCDAAFLAAWLAHPSFHLLPGET
ncbi:DUF6368 family protein [Actinocorallia longicatena]|uniref:Uncharacterized protein n=1 Tax=Actinocorallia longicatena TaxID=111803 RepID=A0ABP6PWR2_9ACTN